MALSKVESEAAVMVAEGRKSYFAIAAKCEVSRQTICNWVKAPEFAAEVERIREEFRKEVAGYSITQRADRIARLQSRWMGIQQVIEERAEQELDFPGKSSGLVVHDVKSIGHGPNAEVVDVFRFDAALIKEERELAKQAAIEVGDWEEKVKHSGTVDTLSDDERAARIAALLGAARARRDRQADSE